jgi:hypothetical protein
MFGWLVVASVESGRQDQFVQLRQPQPVNPAVVIDLDFPSLLQQVLAFQTHCLRGPGSIAAGSGFWFCLHRESHRPFLL